MLTTQLWQLVISLGYVLLDLYYQSSTSVTISVEDIRKLLSKLRLDGISLMIFMEWYHCCYGDGLDGRGEMRLYRAL